MAQTQNHTFGDTVAVVQAVVAIGLLVLTPLGFWGLQLLEASPLSTRLVFFPFLLPVIGPHAALGLGDHTLVPFYLFLLVSGVTLLRWPIAGTILTVVGLSYASLWLAELPPTGHPIPHRTIWASYSGIVAMFFTVRGLVRLVRR